MRISCCWGPSCALPGSWRQKATQILMCCCYYKEVRRGFIILAVIALLGAPAGACSVPVFRYALERWPADRFLGVLFVDGKLSEGQDEVLASIVRAADAPAAGLNLEVVKVDVSGAIPVK